MEDTHFHRICKALADPRRYELLQRIASCKEVACNAIRCEFPISAATLSHHLKELSNAGLIDVRKDAKFIHMKLRRKVWKDYLAQLRSL
jgi:ArsR family transcriptional regulator